jgi:type II secretory pathway pseudopilin PulG
MEKLLKKLNNENGYTLPMVIVVLVVFSILFTSMVIILNSNSKQITTQENNLRAHYLARAGVDIAYAGLLQEDNNQSLYHLKIHRLIDENTAITHSDLSLPDSDPIGSVDVTASIEGDEVKIFAKATMNDGKGKSTIALYIKKDDFYKIRWAKR